MHLFRDCLPRSAAAFLAAGFLLFSSRMLPAADAPPLYQDPKAPLEKRVEDLFGRLTPDEKLSLLSGTEFTTQPIPRLNVPPMGMVDAGQGVRGGMKTTTGPATAFPSGVTMAATWDEDLVHRIAAAIGAEARNKGTGAQVLLGPAVNIQRSPLGGRNGEYFSEDPRLAGRLAVAYIQGMQSTGVAACIKHFACNNEEIDRMFVDVKVGERALREIYLPAFEAGVKDGKVWTLMSSYNKVNGPHASANTYLLTDVLKKGWGYDGLVMSDWGGVHETPVAQAGNDLEMPGVHYASIDKLKAAMKDGKLTPAAVDESARRVLRAVLRTGVLDGPYRPDNSIVNSPEHAKLAMEAATKGIVLLKNEGNLLPLDRTKLKSIAVIGGPATDLVIGALGSPQVKPLHTVQIIEGIFKLLGTSVKINFAPGEVDDTVPPTALVAPDGKPGLQGEYFTGVELQGKTFKQEVDPMIAFNSATAPVPGMPPTNFSVRWTGSLKPSTSGAYTLSFTGDDGFRVKLNGKTVIDQWGKGPARKFGAKVDLEAGKSYPIEITYFQATGDAVARLSWTKPGGSPYSEAVEAAKASDVVILCAGTEHTEGEGHDRPSMDLPDDQNDLIKAVADVNKKTVLVLNNGTPITMTSFINNVPVIVEGWLPGQEGGAAITAVLFGDVNPSGKLPTTFAAARDDYPDAGHFPGKEGKVDYAEGIYVGYRHFDKKEIAPLFPFGHGLSYTTYEYKNLRLGSPSLKADGTLKVDVDITNSGKVAGREIVQLYVHDPKPQIDKPVRELRGFSSVTLAPGETKTVSFTLTPRDFAYFDAPGKQWKADAGGYDIEIGASSRDLRQKAAVKLETTFTESVPLSKEQP